MSDLNLETILQSIEIQKDGRHERISAKKITLRRNGVEAFLGVSGDRRIHFLLGPASNEDIDKLRTVQLRTLSCGILNWSVDQTPPKTFIDVCCLGDFDGPIRKPFLSFSEDLLKHLETVNEPPVEIVHRVFRRWRRFWSGGESSLPTQEWIKGFIGELCFLERMIDDHGNSSVQCWAGPTGGVHDFIGERIAFEVKTSQSHPVTVKINGLNQMDHTRWENLTLALYRLEENAGGRSLTDIVRGIESRLENDSKSLETFWEKLAAGGYRRDQEYYYSKYPYFINGPDCFPVNDEFPKLTKQSFVHPVDLRIFDLKYSIELTGLSPVAYQEFSALIKRMVAGD